MFDKLSDAQVLYYMNLLDVLEKDIDSAAMNSHKDVSEETRKYLSESILNEFGDPKSWSYAETNFIEIPALILRDLITDDEDFLQVIIAIPYSGYYGWSLSTVKDANLRASARVIMEKILRDLVVPSTGKRYYSNKSINFLLDSSVIQIL